MSTSDHSKTQSSFQYKLKIKECEVVDFFLILIYLFLTLTLNPLWLLCPSSRGPGRATRGHDSAPLPNPFISSWKAPLTVSELNQQEEGRAQAELAPGTLLLQARAPGVQPCHRLGPSA